ncbi:Anaerobic dimethyl sulfoxide reductase chain B [Maioricimonas rarisocia]|uniref:Anaerobic dimethyl sulfoxide reductase chain B n=1 Tax=Maioricimonas rarisocia TaxID=2528026 RepID=A0A517Z3D5_9PLAN|nr:DmsC/YnfH family molybdoenzyme membrane anchor subunit [Maioricimonas rarisocia]QDU36989.1 Anaerobic dimethyl sulfoxide reductase chain B [Maioricimonas rarisocia]
MASSETATGISPELPIVTGSSGGCGGCSADSPAAEEGSLISLLLAEQQQLTAVERFSRHHDESDGPALERYYSDLLPASPPKEGQQYAFEVDLDCCSGCKACVTACHSLNGLDEQETWRSVGLLTGGTSHNPVMQHVTTACHHCLEPACMIACPVDAYEKHPETGIVKHLDDQCFGCQYCTLACPYDVPQYHSGKGIVRKCDMCSDRLAEGEAPACVQSCPHKAISIRVVDVEQVREDSEADHFLPGAPEPHITQPTTTYKSKRVFPRNTLPADWHSVSPQHPHWPLIVMLVLTQLSVGAFCVGLLFERTLSETLIAAMRPIHASAALLFGLIALGASTLHLGRPQYAFRAMIGLKHSWLSREILAFGLFAGLAGLYTLACNVPGVPPDVTTGLGWSVAVSGAAGLFCSIMIYVFTRREYWSLSATSSRFVLTAGVLGVSTTWLTLAVAAGVGDQANVAELFQAGREWLGTTLITLAGCKLIFEAALFRHLTDRRTTPLKRSALLMTGPLSNTALARFACGLLGGIVLPLMLLSPDTASQSMTLQTPLIALLFAATLAGELLERYLFFAAVASARMPGGPRP